VIILGVLRAGAIQANEVALAPSDADAADSEHDVRDVMKRQERWPSRRDRDPSVREPSPASSPAIGGPGASFLDAAHELHGGCHENGLLRSTKGPALNGTTVAEDTKREAVRDHLHDVVRT
jgi:hypothetical protein